MGLKNFFDKATSDEPKEIDKITPMNELYDDLKEHQKAVIIYIIASIILGTFLSGLLYQYITTIFSGESIYLLSSFRYGITKSILLTLIIIFLLIGFGFKAYRSLKRSYVKNYKDSYLKSKNETYGGAHFQTEEELRENFNFADKIEDTDGNVFGMDAYGNILTFDYPAGMNHNELYLGAPGCGKSAAIVKTRIYQAMRRGESIVVTDSKGAIYADTSAVARKIGYKVRVLDLKASEFKNSDGYNFFKSIRPGDADMDAKADTIANLIIKMTSSPREENDYWGKNEFNLFKCVIMYVSTNSAYIQTNQNNLPGMFNFISSKSAKDMKGIFTLIPKDNPIRQCYDLFAEADEKNQGQIINGAGIRLSKLTNIYLQQALSHDEIDPVEPMKRKCIYYVIISDTDDSYRLFSALFFSTLVDAQCTYSDKLSETAKQKQLAINFILDEYYATGGIYALPTKIATLRSRKMYLLIILQGIGQLNTMYDEGEVSTILDSCAIKCLLSTNNKETSEFFSDLLGTQTIVVQNDRIFESSADIVHAHSTVQKTFGEGERPLMYPAELRNGKLTRDELIYVISNMQPVKLFKYFSEKNGEAIHPFEKEGQVLGKKKPHLHRPRWRKILEEGVPVPNEPQKTTTTATPQPTQTTKPVPTQTQQTVAPKQQQTSPVRKQPTPTTAQNNTENGEKKKKKYAESSPISNAGAVTPQSIPTSAKEEVIPKAHTPTPPSQVQPASKKNEEEKPEGLPKRKTVWKEEKIEDDLF